MAAAILAVVKRADYISQMSQNCDTFSTAQLHWIVWTDLLFKRLGNQRRQRVVYAATMLRLRILSPVAPSNLCSGNHVLHALFDPRCHVIPTAYMSG